MPGSFPSSISKRLPLFLNVFNALFHIRLCPVMASRTCPSGFYFHLIPLPAPMKFPLLVGSILGWSVSENPTCRQILNILSFNLLGGSHQLYTNMKIAVLMCLKNMWYPILAKNVDNKSKSSQLHLLHTDLSLCIVVHQGPHINLSFSIIIPNSCEECSR